MTSTSPKEQVCDNNSNHSNNNWVHSCYNTSHFEHTDNNTASKDNT